MKLQKLFREMPENLPSAEPFLSWEELNPHFEIQNYHDCYLVLAEVSDEDFDALVGIFQSREEAMGAFLSLALEHGWEEVPQTYCIYHAQEEDGKLLAGLLFDGQINTYEQTTVEQLVQSISRVHRVVVYSYDVVTFIKDIYPEVDQKVFVLAREIARVTGKAPELCDLAKIYGMPCQTLEEKLRLIKRLLENPVRTPYGEVNLPPISRPSGECL